MTDAAVTSRILALDFTDLADSTALKTQRGDQAVGELIARHRGHVRRLAAESGGRIIDWAGDGCFLVFETRRAGQPTPN
jgi:class 3 adenylate cyclase